MGSDGNQRSIEGVDLGCGLKRVVVGDLVSEKGPSWTISCEK